MTQVYVTIDAETYLINGQLPPFEWNLYGECNGREYGIPLIMEICRRYSASATFFVDLYMHYRYGTAKVRDLCRRIAAGGHDVQLHAHPSWLPGSHSGFLYDFSFEVQTAVLREGRDLLHEWLGIPPVAFRAGAYSANLDTLQALADTGFVVDSSYFAQRSTCRLSTELDHRYINRRFTINGILELPVTSYRLYGSATSGKLSKLDINACSLTELTDIVQQLVTQEASDIVIFLHSFSFLRWKNNMSGIMPNYRAVRRFESLLDWLSRLPSVSFSTVGDLALKPWADSARQECVPVVNPMRLIPRALQRVLG